MTKTTAIVFFSIIAVGLVISIFTLKRFAEPVEVVDEPEEIEMVEEPSKPEITEKPKEEPETIIKPEGEKAETPVVEKSEGFTSPAVAMKALASSLSAKDFEAFTELVGEDAIAPEIKEEVKSLVESPDFTIAQDKPFSEISKSATLVRWALNFDPAPAAETEAPKSVAPRQLYADLESIEKKAVDFKKISLPLTAADLSEMDPSTSDQPALDLSSDPLTIAHTFSKAVVARDFRVARALSDPEKVTDERVAALMIAVEEGGFQLRANRPLVVTLSREDITWVLTRITSDALSSEFALELGQSDGDWKIGGLTFSKVLNALAAQAGGGDVAYSPIVEDPEGGDSLVLYFEFDSAGVTNRGKRQLSIIADILSQGAERVIRINGHADALGTDQYNKGLSDGRAGAIRTALIEMGVSPEQVVTEAFGESKPRRPNFNPDGTDNPTGRSQNRRAEVYLDF
ncbi:MAG: OmpA family protein [Verrucomicrobiota bacterium]